MSAQPRTPAQALPETGEPRTGSRPVPVWLIIFGLGLLYWAMVQFDYRGGWFNPQVYGPYNSFAEVQAFQPATGGVSLDRGRAVYENICALCHNTDGNGKPGQAPPLAGAEWVLGSPGRLIRIPLSGITGPIMVKGQEWNMAMPAMGAALSDEDLAAVLSYMRQSWGNKAEPITPEQVKAVRAEVGGRMQPWTAEELNKIP